MGASAGSNPTTGQVGRDAFRVMRARLRPGSLTPRSPRRECGSRDAAGRPPEIIKICAYEIENAYTPSENEIVIDRPHTRFVIQLEG